MKVSFKAKADTNALYNKLNNVLQDKALLTEVNQAFAERIDPYVPYITGRLSKSGLNNVDENGVHYTVSYASDVYNSEFPHNQQHHPLASSHWDEVAMLTEREGFVEDVKEIISKHLKESK
jgi:hypothetical protein